MDGWSLEKVYHHRLNWKPVTFGLLNLVFDSCLVCFAKLALCLKGFRIRQRVDSQTMFGASCPRLSTVMMDMTLIPSPTPTIQIQETEPRSPESSRCGRQNQGVPSPFPPHQQSRSRRQNPGVLNPRGVGAGIGGYWVGFIHHSASQGSLNNMFCHHASPPRCHI